MTNGREMTEKEEIMVRRAMQLSIVDKKLQKDLEECIDTVTQKIIRTIASKDKPVAIGISLAACDIFSHRYQLHREAGQYDKIRSMGSDVSSSIYKRLSPDMMERASTFRRYFIIHWNKNNHDNVPYAMFKSLGSGETYPPSIMFSPDTYKMRFEPILINHIRKIMGMVVQCFKTRKQQFQDAILGDKERGAPAVWITMLEGFLNETLPHRYTLQDGIHNYITNPPTV